MVTYTKPKAVVVFESADGTQFKDPNGAALEQFRIGLNKIIHNHLGPSGINSADGPLIQDFVLNNKQLLTELLNFDFNPEKVEINKRQVPTAPPFAQPIVPVQEYRAPPLPTPPAPPAAPFLPKAPPAPVVRDASPFPLAAELAEATSRSVRSDADDEQGEHAETVRALRGEE